MKKTLVLSLVLVVAANLACLAAPDQAAAPKRRAVLLILDQINLTDLDQAGLPNLSWAISHGGIALMNTRTEKAWSPENTYVTIGAGSRAIGTQNTGSAYAAADPLEGGTAAAILERNTGYRPGGDSLVLPDIAALSTANAMLDHEVLPGLLGQIIHSAGLRTCVLGNADTPDQLRRYAVSLAMDERGTVDGGSIGADVLRSDPRWPFGMRADPDALIEAFDRYAPAASLIAIDFGDTSRLDAYAPYLTPERRVELLHRAIQAADGFLGILRRRLDLRNTLLMVIAPTPNTAALATENSMTPLIAVGPQIEPGLLTSATTQRPGLVANTDIAPTILSFLGLDIPESMVGSPLVSRAADNARSALRAEGERIAAAALWQQPVLKTMTVVLDVVFVLAALLLVWPGMPRFQALRVLILSIIGLPFCLLVVGPHSDPTVFFPRLLGLDLLLAVPLVLIFVRQPLIPLGTLSLITAAAIILDQFLGAPLAKHSLLGYSPVAGARYYGLGNEYMGVLIGAAIMAAGAVRTWWAGRWVMPAVAGAFLLCTAAIGAPMLGANVGGAMAAVAAFIICCLILTGRRVNFRSLALTALIVATAVLLLAVVDSWRAPGAQTHLGRLWTRIESGGLGPFLVIVQRKLAMNFKLVRFSGWSRVAGFALGAMLATALIPAGRKEAFRRAYPVMSGAILAALAGAAAVFLFNDSGIVAAGTLLIYPAGSWLYLLADPMRKAG